jgi:metal-responsive CopG/Arc/MetJ family transcriptional regulator
MTTKPLSTTISAELRDRLDAFVARRGLKKNDVIEEALRMFIAEYDELPHVAKTPIRLVLNDEAFESFVEQLNAPAPAPNSKLSELMRGA